MLKQTTRIYEFDSFSLNATERLLFKDGESLQLAPKAIETLIVLVENHGHVVEKDELMKAVWPDTFVGEDSLTRNISLLRKTLGNSPSEVPYIETLPRRGYRFKATVKECWDDAAEFMVEHHARLRIEQEIEAPSASQAVNQLIEPKPGTDRPPTSQGVNWRSLRSLLAVAALVIVVAVALFYLLLANQVQQPKANDVVQSVAVLPFKKIGYLESGDEHLGAGLADALITRLGQIKHQTRAFNPCCNGSVLNKPNVS